VYSYPRVRAWLERRLIKQGVACLKEHFPVDTRCDKLTASFLAFVNLAIIYLKILARDDPSGRAWSRIRNDWMGILEQQRNRAVNQRIVRPKPSGSSDSCL
jgi:hypothetical protein